MWTAEDIGKYIFLRSRRYAKREAFENVWVLSESYKEVKLSKYEAVVNILGNNLSIGKITILSNVRVILGPQVQE